MPEANKEQAQTVTMTKDELANFVDSRAKALVDGAAGVNGKSSVHVDKPLSDYSVKVVQEDTEFKARMILSNFNSKHRQDMYYFYEPAYFMVNQVAERAEGTEAAKAKYGVSRKSYTTKVYALKQPVTDETVRNADRPIDRIYEDATRFITRQFLLNKEKKFAEALLKAGVWATNWEGQNAAITGGGVVAAGKFQKFSESTSKPLDVLDLAMETIQLKSGLRPNTMVMTRSVFTALKRNSTIKTTKLYTNPNSGADDAILDTIASHLSIAPSRIFILDVVETTGATLTPDTTDSVNQGVNTITTDAEGYATGGTHGFIGGNGILLMHVDMTSSGEYSATAAVCAQWTGLYPDGGELGNTEFKRYREEKYSAEFIEGRTAFSYHIVAPALGAFLKDVI